MVLLALSSVLLVKLRLVTLAVLLFLPIYVVVIVLNVLLDLAHLLIRYWNVLVVALAVLLHVDEESLIKVRGLL